MLLVAARSTSVVAAVVAVAIIAVALGSLHVVLLGDLNLEAYIMYNVWW